MQAFIHACIVNEWDFAALHCIYTPRAKGDCRDTLIAYTSMHESAKAT